jgi:putative protease
MSILVPLNSIDMLDSFLSSGVDEFYLGFHDPEWETAFGARSDLNRMSGFGTEANALTFTQAVDLTLNLTCDKGARAYLTFNAASYSKSQVTFIAEHYLPVLRLAGVDGIILSSLDLVDAVIRQGLTAVASTMCGIYNADIARFYQNRGVTRMVLPRDLSLAHIAAIIEAVEGVAFEVFLMRNGCIFSDSHCLGIHCAGEPSLCMSVRQAEPQFYGWGGHDEAAYGRLERTRENNTVYRESFHLYACGQCALWRFDQMGVASYKIVGRGDQAEQICLDAALTARNLPIAKHCTSDADYHALMERPSNQATLCKDRLSCYYPQR